MNAIPAETHIRASWLAALVLFLPLSLFATPPRPPAQIVLPKELMADSVDLREGQLSFSLTQNEPVAVVEISVTQQEVATGKQLFARQEAVALLSKRKIEGKALGGVTAVKVNAERPGTYLLDIRISGMTTGGAGFSDRLIRYLVIGEKRAATLLTPGEFARRNNAPKERAFNEQMQKDPRSHPIRLLFSDTISVPAEVARGVRPHAVPNERKMIVRPEGPSPFLRKHSVDSSGTDWSPTDNITIRGRIVFQDFDGVWKPLVNVSVNIWDSDFGFDEHLGVVATDWDGRWSFTCNDDDGWFQDGRDIYYTFKLENTRLSVGSCNFLAGAYEWKSGVHDNVSDGSVVDFGEETAGDNMNALQVWNTLNLAWNHAITVGGWEPGKIDACYPSSSTFYDGKVNVQGSDNDGPDSITHEYGHALMAHAYSGGDPSPGGSHGFGDCNQNQSLSWSEGWATAFMLSARPDGEYNWHEGQAGRAIEAFSSSCHLGESSEGWVAAALLDLMDSANDDNGGNLDRGRNEMSDHNAGNQVALATILRDTLVGNHHNNVLEFWTSLAGELDSTRRVLGQEIMRYDWMSVLPPISCVATKVAAQREKNPEPLLTGLRQFRDYGLKKWPHGRELINVYYRNSPEIALNLLTRPELVSEALRVMKHFSTLGSTMGDHEAYLRLMGQNPAVIPADVADAMLKLIDALDTKASEGLRRDLRLVRTDVEQLRKQSVQDYQARIQKEFESGALASLPAVQQTAVAPGSQQALKDENLQKFLDRLVQPAR